MSLFILLLTSSCSTMGVIVSDFVPQKEVCNLIYQGTINTYSDGGYFWDYLFAPFADTAVLIYSVPKTLGNVIFKGDCAN